MSTLSRMIATLLTALPLMAVADTGLSYDYDGKTFSDQSLPAAIRTQLYELDLKMNEQRQQIVDQHILEVYLKDVAKEQGKTAEEVAAERLDVPKPDEKAIRAYYDENWERIQQPYNEVKDQLESLVWNQQQQDKVKELIKSIGSIKHYKVNLPVPDSPRFDIKTSGYPMKGDADAPVTVVEFADFQCPHCKDAVADMNRILAKHGEQVRLVYRHMPINISGISRKVAEASVCADQQGKFWEYHALAFAGQNELNEESPLQLAKELKLDEDKMKSCLADPATAKAITDSEEEGAALGVTGTPSFFVNGKLFVPQFELEKELVAAIEAEIAKLQPRTGTMTPEVKPE